jgi:hypothetical protein
MNTFLSLYLRLHAVVQSSLQLKTIFYADYVLVGALYTINIHAVIQFLLSRVFKLYYILTRFYI